VTPDALMSIDRALAQHFAHAPQRASVSYVGVDPIEVLRFEPIPGDRAYVSLGMSRQPMTAAHESVQAAEGPRAELLLELHDPTDSFADVWRRLAVLAAAPAVEGVVYAPGMTVDLGERLVAGSRCTGVVITESPIGEIGTPVGPVTVLQATPAAATELAWCRVRGSSALRDRWTQHGTDLLDITRSPVPLDG
jgi:hypothetical protein